MFERSTSAEVVARAFLLAEELKRAPRTAKPSARSWKAQRKKLAALSGTELFKLIEVDRRKRIELGSWVFTIINLDRCAVWPGMGGEDWARGPVAKISGQFPSKAQSGNRTRAIRERVQEIFAEFPIIGIRTRSDHTRIRIEDGSHRAVAYYLAGFRQVFAYVARVPSAINLTWKWEG